MTDDAVYSCGEAMERAYELTGFPPTRLLELFRHVPGYEPTRDATYRWIANNRSTVGRITRLVT